MTKKLLMTALMATAMTLGLQAQDDGYKVDATTGATEQNWDKEKKEKHDCGKCAAVGADTIWYNDLTYSKQNKNVSLKKNIYSSTKSGMVDYLRDLDDVACFVSAHQGAKVTVVGFTTTTVKGKGKKATTTKQNCAENIKKALMARGVSESAITVDASAEEAQTENGIYKLGVVSATGTETTEVPVMAKKYQLVEKPQPVENNPTVKKISKWKNAISRFHLGGYGEVVMTRNFYSQSFNRYNAPQRYADDASHGRFDLPHVCLNFGYDFGKGWTLGSEIEFEHGGTESAVEIEAEESGEYEAETEKGGEVALEQFWINKEFWKGKFNVKAGEIIVPVGLSNAHHEPMNFFTCYRPEGEATILPNTWHQLGVSLWGRIKDWRYEAQFLSGLNSEAFRGEYFVHYGAQSPYEFKVANVYAGALRVDNYSIKGLRIGVSGYYGRTFRNSLKTPGSAYDDVTGALGIISADFTLNRWNWIVRGSVDYAHLSDADAIAEYNKANSTHHKYQDGNPFHNTNLGSNAMAWSIEAGYDFFSQIHKLRKAKHMQKMYVFGRFEHYNTMASGTYASQYKQCKPYRFAVGLNYMPLKQIVVKGEYSYRFFEKPDNGNLQSDSPLYEQPFNNEPSISLSIAYQGQFF